MRIEHDDILNTKAIIISVSIGIALIIGVTIYPISEEIQPGSEEIQPGSEEKPEVTEKLVGVVEGVVYYIGKPCPPSNIGPPCNGPYPNYEVSFYEIDGTSPVNRIITDEEGNFEVHLPVGEYLVFEKNFVLNKVEEIPILFTVEPDRKNTLEISINEGLR